MKKPLVSVIIPSVNSASTIGACLESVVNQSYRPLEIIVVDNNSTDETVTIAKKYTKHVYRAGPERSAQINFGARHAHGKYLYRVDSDFLLEPHVISQCVGTCEEKKLDAVAIHNTSADGLGFWADVRKLERDMYREDSLIVAVRFFTKISWQEIGGFDESLYGPEDYDFHNRFVSAGFKWGRIQAIERHLGEPKSLADIWHKHLYYGKQMVGYFSKHPTIAAKQFNPIRESYFRHFPKIVSRPKLAVGLCIMIVAKFTAGGIGFIIGLIENTHNNKPTSPKDATVQLFNAQSRVGLFARVRFWTGSFTELESYVPDSGVVVDLGSGYGILSNYLALQSPKRQIIGIELDSGKVSQAVTGSKNVSFRHGDITSMRLPKADAIIIADVLHHLHSFKDQDLLIERCFGLLKSGGRLIISEVDNTPFWKLVAARCTDFLLYPGQPIYYRYKKNMMRLLEKYFKLQSIEVHKITNTVFPHILYACKKG